jgi:hypothetical protein
MIYCCGPFPPDSRLLSWAQCQRRVNPALWKFSACVKSLIGSWIMDFDHDYDILPTRAHVSFNYVDRNIHWQILDLRENRKRINRKNKDKVADAAKQYSLSIVQY